MTLRLSRNVISTSIITTNVDVINNISLIISIIIIIVVVVILFIILFIKFLYKMLLCLESDKIGRHDILTKP